jgi:hypothetical protein
MELQKRTFLLVDQDEIDARVAENIKSRELELLSYDFERANHEAAIESLGDLQWDETTSRYKGMSRDEFIARALADGLDSATIQKVSDLHALASHRLNLEAVKVETAKSERHYDNLLKALPEGDRRDSAINALKLQTKPAVV